MNAVWMDDLEHWLQPFLAGLSHRARRRMCPLYIAGLIGPGDRKSAQPMAARRRCRLRSASSFCCGRGLGQLSAGGRATEGGRSSGRRSGGLSRHRRHSITKEGTIFSWRRASIRFLAWQDIQLPVTGVCDPGLARSARDGGPSALLPDTWMNDPERMKRRASRRIDRSLLQSRSSPSKKSIVSSPQARVLAVCLPTRATGRAALFVRL